MIASLSKSTQKQYNAALKPWLEFCISNNLDGFNPDTSSLLSYLTVKFKEGASYGTLNSARTAISLLSKDKIGENVSICRFLKGVSKLRPPKPKYAFTWDVSIVLKYLENLCPLDKISFTDLTYKTVMLLLLCTAHRAQTIANIRLNNITFSSDQVMIHISDNIKTSAVGRCQPLLILPFYSQNPKICPARALLNYIEKSKTLSLTRDKLFIAVRKPYNEVGAQTISRWAKEVLGKSGIDLKIFTAHSIRHAATSLANSKGNNLDTIRRTAGWSEQSQVFAKFYNKPVLPLDSQEFAISILKN